MSDELKSYDPGRVVARIYEDPMKDLIGLVLAIKSNGIDPMSGAIAVDVRFVSADADASGLGYMLDPKPCIYFGREEGRFLSDQLWAMGLLPQTNRLQLDANKALEQEVKYLRGEVTRLSQALIDLAGSALAKIPDRQANKLFGREK